MPNGNEVVVIVAIVIAVALVLWGKRPRDLPTPPTQGGGAEEEPGSGSPRAS